MTFGERCVSFFKNLQQGVRQDPVRVAIPADHVQGEELGTTFTPGEHYFQVRVNEMYLTYSRKWWVEYDPMVFVVSEFTYGTEVREVPFVVGPAMMDKYKQKLPAHMVFENTRVAGLHPWRGGRLNLAVILYAVKKADRAHDLFKVVEGAAQVVDFGTSLNTYLKVASVVLDGAEMLLGLADTSPIVGLRSEFDQDAKKDGFKPGYLALISPEFKVDPSQLWVCNGQLFNDRQGTDPFRKADYVLYSIIQTDKRSDERLLPFFSSWERIAKEATIPRQDAELSARSNFASWTQEALFSPDLTDPQANALVDEYEQKLTGLLATAAKRFGRRGGGKPVAPTKADTIRARSLDILRAAQPPARSKAGESQ